MPGTPDFCFRRERLAVFLDGCFWHGCRVCRRRPASNVAYWTAKIVRNRERDARVSSELRALGWRVLRIWEHELKSPEAVIKRLRQRLSSSRR